MIMDSMGALALATENPTPELLLLRPHGRDEPLISMRMWKHIVTQGLYQVGVCVCVCEREREREMTACKTMHVDGSGTGCC
jgi:magnesium-transporting ATPase (P-type)